MRIPPQSTGLSSTLSQSITELRDRIKTTSQEAVTGQHSDLTVHLSGRIGTAMLSQRALDNISLEREQITLRESRLDITQRSLNVMHDSASGLDVQMLSAIGQSDRIGQAAAAQDARAALEEIFTTLNARQGERFLFSGDATSTVPMGAVEDLLADITQIAETAGDTADFKATLDTYFNSPTGGWQSSIYKGTPTASDPDSVTAADPAITALISGLSVLALAGPDEGVPAIAGNEAFLEAAALRVSSGQTALTDLRADRGLVQERLSRAKDTLDAEETILTTAFTELTGRDQYEAASELKELEANLEASYLLTARLASLNLLNYLR